MKIKVNTKIITKLNPCTERLDNWKIHYNDFNGDISEFLDLSEITHSDKMWIVKKLVPIEILVIFALDCSFSAAAYAAYSAAYSAADAADAVAYAAAYSAADAAAYAAYSAAYSAADAADAVAYAAAARKTEQDRQIDALIYLIKGE